MNCPKSFFLIIIFSITIPFISYSADNSPEQKALLEAAAKAGAKAALAAQASQRSYTKLFFYSACIGGISYGLYHRPWASNADLEKIGNKNNAAIKKTFSRLRKLREQQFTILNSKVDKLDTQSVELGSGISMLQKEMEQHFTAQEEKRNYQRAIETARFAEHQKNLNENSVAFSAQLEDMEKKQTLKLKEIRQDQLELEKTVCRHSVLQELQNLFLKKSLESLTKKQEETKTLATTALEQAKGINEGLKENNKKAESMLYKANAFQEETKEWSNNAKTTRDLLESMARN